MDITDRLLSLCCDSATLGNFTARQLATVLWLHRHREDADKRAVRVLARAVRCGPPIMTRIYSRLLKRGLITRVTPEEDRRCTLATLTASGTALALRLEGGT